MKTFALDVETTIYNKGDPFDQRNKLVLGGWGTTSSCVYFDNDKDQSITQLLAGASLVIGFNFKFDLHWLRNIGVTIPIRLPVWDCQLAEFILSNQTWKYPSLEESCTKRGLGHKIDVVKSKYWNNGIDTDCIPHEELAEYLKQDISLTFALYEAQKVEFKKPEHAGKYNLFRLQCYDLLVLQAMEYNGYKFDQQGAANASKLLTEECLALDRSILNEFPDIPINLASPDHISCMLYGGTITDEVYVPIGTYKTGTRAGEVKLRKFPKEYVMPRLIEPDKKTALAKEGYYGTSEDVLRNLESTGRVKKIIDNILTRRGIAKLQGTYYNGIPKLIESHCWKDSIVHGQLNQCVAKSSRLTATKPNQQNMPSGCKQYCVSRYE